VPREPLGRAAVVKDDRLQQQGVLNVKKSRLMAVLATCAAGCLLWMGMAARPALSQQRPPMMAPAAPSVAVIDIGRILKEHAAFRAEMTQIKDDMTRAKAAVKKENDSLAEFGKTLNDYVVGSPDYKRTEEEFVQRKTRLQMYATTQEQEIVLRQSQAYNRAYQEISQEVEYFCTTNGISLVLNYNSAKVDTNNPEDVLHMVFRPVVYRQANLDITPIIIQRLTERRGQVGNRVAIPPASTQGVGGGLR
jgi:Skp family chaperone for outer membrane proteins